MFKYVVHYRLGDAPYMQGHVHIAIATSEHDARLDVLRAFPEASILSVKSVRENKQVPVIENNVIYVDFKSRKRVA